MSIERRLADELKRMYDIPPQRGAQARRTLATYAALVTEIARAARLLQRNGQPDLGAKLVRYASEVTDLACEYAAKSGEIDA